MYIYPSHLGMVSVVWSGPQIPILRLFQATATCLHSLFIRVRWSLDMEESKSDCPRAFSKAKAKSHRFRRHEGKGERRRQVAKKTMSTGRRERCQVRQTFSLDRGKVQGRFAIITHATATSYIAPQHTSYTWLQQNRLAYLRIFFRARYTLRMRIPSNTYQVLSSTHFLDSFHPFLCSLVNSSVVGSLKLPVALYN